MSRRKPKHHRVKHDDEEPQAAVAVEGAENAPEPDEVGIEPPDVEGAEGVPSPETETDRLSREADEMRALAQRKQAEFENYRRRIERERADSARYAGFELIKEVLPVMDNLERAIRASDSSPEETFRAGVEIIHRQFQEILTRQGLSELASQGKPFDPHVHEAVKRVETDEHPDGVVVDVFQKGYMFKDRLLRPAMVSVAQAPPGSDDSREERRENQEDVASGPE